jgi:NAD(P)H-dependent flavin oxidoreductase YrpB (nitropropane dioxygenase family)
MQWVGRAELVAAVANSGALGFITALTVYEIGDLDAGIWSVGTAMGLINDIATVGDLVSRIVEEAEELITGRLADMVEPEAEENVA